MTGWYEVRPAAALPVRHPGHAFLSKPLPHLDTTPTATSRRAAITMFSSPSAASSAIFARTNQPLAAINSWLETDSLVTERD